MPPGTQVENRKNAGAKALMLVEVEQQMIIGTEGALEMER